MALRAAFHLHGPSALMALPGLVLLLALFAYPVLRLFALSIDGGTFAPYLEILTDDFYAHILSVTFQIGLLVTLLSIVLGYPLAYAMANAPRFWSIVIVICVMVPFWTSILVRTYAWMIILGREGVINSVLLTLGFIDRPLQLLHNRGAVVVGMVHVLMPFFVLPVYAAMRRIEPHLLQAGEGLGANMWDVFRDIYFPLTLPGVCAGASLVFILSIGFFIAPAMLGGGRVMMMAVLIEQEVRRFLNWELAAALSVLLLAATLLVYALIHRLGRPRKGSLG